MDIQTKAKALGRLRRIEGQVQGIQRMVEEDKSCVDILLQLTAVQGAVEQVQKLLSENGVWERYQSERGQSGALVKAGPKRTAPKPACSMSAANALGFGKLATDAGRYE